MTLSRTCVVIGGGTMGADIALTLARAGCPTHLVETFDHVREALPARLAAGLAALGCPDRLDRIEVHASLDDVDWPEVDVAIEAVPERLDIKRALFADLARRARPDAWLTSNSSSFPISAIAEGLPGPGRFFGLHYFMPAHLVPLVEVVCGAGSDAALAREVAEFMRSTGKVPVIVKKDLPGFLANRLQHALGREALALVEAGVATPEDVDAAVRFGFGFRYLAAGPLLQRDHAGLDVHAAAAATMYPGLAAGKEPAKCLTDRVAAGRLGMKAGAGFYDWTPETIAAERARYEAILRGALSLLEPELPKVQG
ncbi:MAG: 3-hydroxyacyl-CoA dehydrogenase NAD-binding domain-containing protein [Lysobacter sp.]|nr:3-hydroxyacyl-CoA dehydrogenase NAD-binding domain-containing protein [Lysobacter sp.]